MNADALASLSRIEQLHKQFDQQAKELLDTLAAEQKACDIRSRALTETTRAMIAAINAVMPRKAAVDAADVIEARLHDSCIDDSFAPQIAEIASELDTLLVGRGFEPTDAEQWQALWAPKSDPTEPFGMFNDWAARLSLDEDRLRDISGRLFDMLDDEASVVVLSDLFADYVRNELDPPDLDEVVKRNAADPHALSGDVCHTHDFIDSNECMLDALVNLGLTFKPDDEQQADLTNKAWRAAKARGFTTVHL